MAAKGGGGKKSQVFEVLSPSSRRVLAVAEVARRHVGESRADLPHLLIGLFEKDPGPARRALGAHNVTEQHLEKLLELPVREILEFVWGQHLELEQLPALARDAQRVLDGADAQRKKEGGDRLRTRDLLSAMLELDDLPVVQELRAWGVPQEVPTPEEYVQKYEAEENDDAPSTGVASNSDVGATEEGTADRAPVVADVLIEAGPLRLSLVSRPDLSVPDADAVVFVEKESWRHYLDWLGPDAEPVRRELEDVATKVHIGQPLLVPLPDEVVVQRGPRPHSVILMTTLDDDGVVDHARAVQGLVSVCQDGRTPDLAVSLLDALMDPTALESFLHSLIEEAPGSQLRNVTLIHVDDARAEVISSLVPSLQEVAQAWAPVPERSGLQADAVRGRDEKTLSELDSLGMGEQAEVFARAVVDAEFRPPLAIGLFGDWGCGKTFFMGLMREEVDRLTALRDARYVSRAVQIEFNAWHYVDADLWATLATRIFDELVEPLQKQRGDKDPAVTRRELRRKIRSSAEEREEAVREQGCARTEREVATRQIDRLRAQRVEEQDRSAQMRMRRLWGEFSKEPEFTKVSATLKAAADAVGVNHAVASIEDVQEVRTRLQGLRGDASSLVLALRQLFTSKHWPVTVAVLLFAGIVVVTGPVVVEWMQRQFPDLNAASIALSTVVAQLAGMGGAAASRIAVLAHGVRRWLEAAHRAEARLAEMDRVDRVPTQDEIDKMPVESQKSWNREIKVLQEAAALDARIEAADRKLAEADRRISEAEAEIQRIDAGGLVYDFLAERGADPRYRDRLGLISLIRRDFERLSSLLADWAKHGMRGDEVPRGQQPIERIILYIDDLDRCPPERVVEVLQAVHLLLAFDLFIVVVGVDARWLERSLQDTYDPVADVQADARVRRHAFDAHNYLEKIFQIPFALGGLTTPGFEQLVDDLVVTRTEHASKQAKASAQSTAESAESCTVSGDQQRAGQTAEEQDDATGRDHADATDEPVVGGERSGQVGEVPDSSAREILEPLVLEDWEAALLRALAPFVGTPRLAKRLLNVYRLLRVRAARLGSAAFLNRGHGEYRAAALLLAIQIGHPEAASHIVAALERSPTDANFPSLLDRLATEARTEAVGRELARVRSRWEQVRNALIEAKAGVEACYAVDAYVRWAPEVGRYSFRWPVTEGAPQPAEEPPGATAGGPVRAVSPP